MNKRNILFLFGLVLLSIFTVGITFTAFPAFSGFAAGLAKATIGILIFVAIDSVALKEVDTLHEIIIKKNTAYAILIFSYALILAATIATA